MSPDGTYPQGTRVMKVLSRTGHGIGNQGTCTGQIFEGSTFSMDVYSGEIGPLGDAVQVVDWDDGHLSSVPPAFLIPLEDPDANIETITDKQPVEEGA